MSESRQKLRRKHRMLAENPVCCLCGGEARATTEDHIPPRACFPPGYHPTGMEFPACDGCNQSTKNYDHVFGFYAMALDYNSENLDPEIFQKRIAGIINNHPETLPIDDLKANEKRRKFRTMKMQLPPGMTYAESGVTRLARNTDCYQRSYKKNGLCFIL